MPNLSSVLLFGLLGHVASNLGFGLQKAGADSLKMGFGLFRSGPALRQFGVWVFGLALYGLGTVLVFQALSLGDAALVSSLSGVGLVALAIFSALVLREAFNQRILIGVGLITLGTAVIGFFGVENTRAFQFNLPMLVIYLVGLVLAAGAAFLWARQSGRRRLTGLIVAFVAGVMGGSALLFHKAGVGLCAFNAADPTTVACLARLPYFYLGFVVGTAALGVIQYAYQFSSAIEVVPTYAGTILLTPIFGGMLIFSEAIAPAQWPGVAAAALGTILISSGSQSTS